MDCKSTTPSSCNSVGAALHIRTHHKYTLTHTAVAWFLTIFTKMERDFFLRRATKTSASLPAIIGRTQLHGSFPMPLCTTIAMPPVRRERDCLLVILDARILRRKCEIVTTAELLLAQILCRRLLRPRHTTLSTYSTPLAWCRSWSTVSAVGTRPVSLSQ